MSVFHFFSFTHYFRRSESSTIFLFKFTLFNFYNPLQYSARHSLWSDGVYRHHQDHQNGQPVELQKTKASHGNLRTM